MTINASHAEALYRFIWSILRERDCHLYRIGGIENHIHILFDLNPRHTLMDIMRDLKRESSKWMKSSGLFPAFEGWGKEYFACGLSHDGLNQVIEYIKNQRSHHCDKNITFEAEFRHMVEKEALGWDEILLTQAFTLVCRNLSEVVSRGTLSYPMNVAVAPCMGLITAGTPPTCLNPIGDVPGYTSMSLN